MEVEISSSVKIFKLYPRERNYRSGGNIGAFKFVISQSMAVIFLSPDFTGSIHSASMTQRQPPIL
jgi:hypothetical protein